MYMHSNYPVSMNALLTLAVERKASDVHLVPGGAPLVRVNREMVRLDYPDLRPEEVRARFRLKLPKEAERFLAEKYDGETRARAWKIAKKLLLREAAPEWAACLQ